MQRGRSVLGEDQASRHRVHPAMERSRGDAQIVSGTKRSSTDHQIPANDDDVFVFVIGLFMGIFERAGLAPYQYSLVGPQRF